MFSRLKRQYIDSHATISVRHSQADAHIQERPNLKGILGPWEHPSGALVLSPPECRLILQYL